MNPSELPPVIQPVAIFDQFIARQTETMILKEKILSLSGDSFDVKLANGQPILKVQGKVMTISGRKSIYDMAGNHLFDIVKEHFHIHTTFAAHDSVGNRILQVRNSITLIGSRATATFTSPQTGTIVNLKMKGNWLDNIVDIIDDHTGAVVARIDRKIFRGRELFFSKQTYGVVVAPGVDMALIAAMCICFDEKNNERRAGSVY
ncbi:hypothetical protein DTO207G8_8035 [Paecilomyces variotii]|nr:hypothetical protein DTO169E5_8524 [Paecilomyces variotii]KAJ9247569.1 hypothetical protein DTO207G8_8035 [Paecilomyces variotii]KAJ9347759.1 hypothetical protein DTO027B9_8863 [Paecilomyces variotii]KAJ9392825.1 hypothetical protein DTO063F5_625 [Paecilomyces variotii]